MVVRPKIAQSRSRGLEPLIAYSAPIFCLRSACLQFSFAHFFFLLLLTIYYHYFLYLLLVPWPKCIRRKSDIQNHHNVRHLQLFIARCPFLNLSDSVWIFAYAVILHSFQLQWIPQVNCTFAKFFHGKKTCFVLISSAILLGLSHVVIPMYSKVSSVVVLARSASLWHGHCTFNCILR